MKYYLILLTIAAISVQLVKGSEHSDLETSVVQRQTPDLNAEVVRKCLSHANATNIAEQLEKVAHYSDWKTEEISCFTRCIANEKGWFNISENDWNTDQIIADLNESINQYCMFEFIKPNENACEFAYQGFRCLKQADLHMPLIEKARKECDIEAKDEKTIMLKACDNLDLNAFRFKCLAEKMDLYTSDYEWKSHNWMKLFGPVWKLKDYTECKASINTIKKSKKCTWIYEEFQCIIGLVRELHMKAADGDYNENVI